MTVIDKGAEPYRSTILALGKILKSASHTHHLRAISLFHSVQ